MTQVRQVLLVPLVRMVWRETLALKEKRDKKVQPGSQESRVIQVLKVMQANQVSRETRGHQERQERMASLG